MNPVLQALSNSPRKRQTADFGKTLDDIRSGRIDPKARVLEYLSGNPNARERMKKNLPVISGLARKLGVSDAAIDAFAAAVKL